MYLVADVVDVMVVSGVVYLHEHHMFVHVRISPDHIHRG
jgi:hypothetical protein